MSEFSEEYERRHAQRARGQDKRDRDAAARRAWWQWAGTTLVAVVALTLSIISLTRQAPAPTVVLVPAASVGAPSTPTTLPPAPSSAAPPAR